MKPRHFKYLKLWPSTQVSNQEDVSEAGKKCSKHCQDGQLSEHIRIREFIFDPRFVNDVNVAEDGEDEPGAAVEEQAEGVVSVDDGRVLDSFIQRISNNVD